MFDLFQTSLEAISDFMDRGGPVLWLIALLLFVKWSLMFERLWFLNTVHKKILLLHYLSGKNARIKNPGMHMLYVRSWYLEFRLI